jgi:hypothetical protein
VLWRVGRWVAAAVLVFAGVAIARPWMRHDVRVGVVVRPLPAPAERDRGDACADVGEARACWGTGCEGACQVDRPVPSVAAPAGGWRCDGMGAERVCEARRRNSGPFECGRADGGCVQREPRVPDDGEWECVETDGASYCHERGPAAAVVAGRMDPGWLCGSRKGAPEGERVCVDFSPDRPDRGVWQCSFRGDLAHTCVPTDVAGVGSACSDQHACPRDATCVRGVCLPPRPTPNCWLDADCGEAARCRWGTCAGGGA